MNLSDAYAITDDEEISLDLKVKVINISYEKQHKLLDACPCLKEYAQFIYEVRQNQKKNMSLDHAVERAIEYCISNNIMMGFLMKYGKEGKSMLTMELTPEEIAEIRAEEMAEEMTEEKREMVRGMLAAGLTHADVMKIANVDESYLAAI